MSYDATAVPLQPAWPRMWNRLAEIWTSATLRDFGQSKGCFDLFLDPYPNVGQMGCNLVPRTDFVQACGDGWLN